MADLKIVIGGDAKGLQDELKKSQAELGKTAIAAQKLDSSLANSSKGFSNIGSKAQIASTALSGVKSAAGQAAGEITGLSTSLLSGGLSLAIPVIISGIIALGQALLSATDDEKKFAEQQAKINESLNGAESAYVKATKQVQDLKIAFQQAEDGIITQDAAVKLYNKTLGTVTGTVNTLAEAEAALAKNGGAYIKYTLLKAAANQALEASSKKLLEAEVLIEEQNRVVNEKKYETGFFGRSAAQQREDDALKLQEGRKAAQQASADYLEIQKNFNERAQQIAKDFHWTGTPDKIKEVDEIKIKPKKVIIEPKNDTRIIFAAQLKDVPTPVVYFRTEILPMGKGAKNIMDEIERVRKEAAQRLDSFQDLFASIGQDIIVSFAEGIGNAVAGKGFQQFFQNIFSSVGAGLKKLGIYFLAGSKLISQIKKLILTIPALSAVAAIGLIALGTAIQAGASKNAFATGVRNFGGGTALVGERGPELVQLPSGSNVVPNGQLNAMSGSGNAYIMETVIRGQDLAVVLKRANQTISRNG